MRSKQYDSIVIGGGVIGSSIAFNLSKKGQRVLLIEKDRIASKASSAAAGMLGVQTENEENGPLFELARTSRSLFPELSLELRELTGIDINLIRKGLLKLALKGEQVEEFHDIQKWQHSKGEEAVWLEKEEVLELEPCLSEKMKGALFFPNEGQVSAPDLSIAFSKAAGAMGTKIREFTEVQSLIKENGTVQGVITNAGSFYGETVIVAAGAWSSPFLEEKEQNVYPVKGEALSVISDSPLLTRTLFSNECYFVPKRGGEIIIGATSIPHTFDQKVTLKGISYLMERAKELVPILGTLEIQRIWAGIRPMTKDGLPYLGWHPEIKNLYVASGHYRNGILLSPVTGKIVAEMVAESREPEMDLTSFRLLRTCTKQEARV